jgi:hypothetical protein
MDEFGEERSFYIWPLDHEDGQPYRRTSMSGSARRFGMLVSTASRSDA